MPKKNNITITDIFYSNLNFDTDGNTTDISKLKRIFFFEINWGSIIFNANETLNEIMLESLY